MNKFLNIKSVFDASNSTWDYARREGVVDLAVKYSATSPFMLHNDKEFINMASCSYLGFDTHPKILQGASNAVHTIGALHLTTPRYKVFVEMLATMELLLTQHFNNTAISYITCSAATSAFLPLYASGILSDGKKPFMVFDKHAHFSINHIKPICGDATEVITCQHNDLNYIEDMCKKYKNVAYITEGVYSINGFSPIDDLMELQDKYGLFLYFDDSHGLSVIGEKGQGFVLQKNGILNSNTVVVGSLAKAFGACGGVLITGNTSFKEKLIRYGNSWSQYVNSAGIGAIISSLELHKTNEFTVKQSQWRDNLQYIDSIFPLLLNKGTLSPTRILPTKTKEDAIILARNLFNAGYYVSPVFFPTVSKNSPGIRFMPRADMSLEILNKFCNTLKHEANINS